MEEIIRPEDIEKRSFEIITRELEGTPLLPGTEDIVKRCIHTSADFDYAKNLFFSPGAVEEGLRALKEGATVITDTQMALAGISKGTLEKLGGRALCFMGKEDVAREAKERGVTRAYVSMERAASLEGPLIFAIGNAPTALFSLENLIREGKLNPRLIIAVPVGFVNVCESKERILSLEVPCIVARGRKGGSNIAACIVNALMYRLVDRG